MFALISVLLNAFCPACSMIIESRFRRSRIPPGFDGAGFGAHHSKYNALARKVKLRFHSESYKNGRANIDGGGVESLDGLVEFDPEFFVNTEGLRRTNQGLGELRVDCTVPT